MILSFFKKLGRVSFPSFFIFSLHAQDVFNPPPVKYSKKAKITISKNLKQNFIFLISKMGEIHKNFKDTNTEQLHGLITQMIHYLKQIHLFKETHLSYHRKIYLNRQLRLIEDHLLFILQKNLSLSQKTSSLKKIYKELIQIYQFYILEDEIQKQYAVYYCSKNEGVWIQKNNLEVYNPFSNDYRKCGKKIY